MIKTFRWHPIDPGSISRDDFVKLDKNSQKEIMQQWFSNNFEDPVENCPHDEGEYVYIWGGPYNAEEELESEFGDIASKKAIKELSNKLSRISFEWSGKPTSEDYDNYVMEIASSNTEYFNNFLSNLNTVEKLLAIDIQKDLRLNYYRLLYANVITAMETYLFDAFVNKVFKIKENLRKFISTTKYFQEKKITISEIFERYESIENEVKDYLLSFSWHNLPMVKPLYKNTLNVDFPQDISELYKAVLCRHDIVHRNGRNKKGEEVIIARDDISNLVEIIKKFVDLIDSQLNKP